MIFVNKFSGYGAGDSWFFMPNEVKSSKQSYFAFILSNLSDSFISQCSVIRLGILFRKAVFIVSALLLGILVRMRWTEAIILPLLLKQNIFISLYFNSFNCEDFKNLCTLFVVVIARNNFLNPFHFVRACWEHFRSSFAQSPYT